MNDLMSNFVAKVAEVSKDARPKLETIKIANRTVVIRTEDGSVIVDHTPEVLEAGDVELDAEVIDTVSMAEWMTKIALEPGIVEISRKGKCQAGAGPLRQVKSITYCTRPFFAALLPPARATAQQWLEWWDKVSFGVNPEASQRINAAVTSISAVSAKSLTINQSGATVSVAVNAENGVKTQAPLPKRFVATIPFGDPAYKAEICVSLRLSTHNDQVIFETSIDEYFEGKDPFTEYVDWCCKQLKPFQEAGWTILRTA